SRVRQITFTKCESSEPRTERVFRCGRLTIPELVLRHPRLLHAVDFRFSRAARRVTGMSAEAQPDVIVRPVRDVDVEALGRVHAQCWHETYDHLISKAALEKVSPRRLAELWTHWAVQGPEFKMSAALVNGEIVGFVGSGPARDKDAPRGRELYFIY